MQRTLNIFYSLRVFFYVTNKESKHSRKISAAQEDTDIDVAKSCLYIEQALSMQYLVRQQRAFQKVWPKEAEG